MVHLAPYASVGIDASDAILGGGRDVEEMDPHRARDGHGRAGRRVRRRGLRRLPTESSAASAEPEAGGTLNIALISDVQDAFDPQKEYSSVTWEYFRCCLLRTLLSYNGQTTDEGGSELRPDLAAEMPDRVR